MLKTILSGVFIFVLGQFVLKLVLDPIVSLRNVFGEISALFLREQRNIVNAQGTEEIQNEIWRLSASLLAHRKAIYIYKLFSFLLFLPNEKALLESCGALNRIAYLIVKRSDDPYEKIEKYMKMIAKNLKICTEYTMIDL